MELFVCLVRSLCKIFVMCSMSGAHVVKDTMQVLQKHIPDLPAKGIVTALGIVCRHTTIVEILCQDKDSAKAVFSITSALESQACCGHISYEPIFLSTSPTPYSNC